MPIGHPSPLVTIHCSYCGAESQRKEHKIRNGPMFCSRQCHGRALAKRVQFACKECKQPFDVKRYDQHKRGGYCSTECARKGRTTFAGRKVFRSDSKQDLYGRICVICGYERFVEYAHLIPARRGGTVHPDNIIALCPNHHTLFDRHLLDVAELAVIAEFLARAYKSQFAVLPKVQVA